MGRHVFITQLQALGYAVEERGENRLACRYSVPVGRLAGEEIWLGFVVNDDFPLSPPSGPHVSPRLLPLSTNESPSVHPTGGIHTSPFGDDWEYWSRPFNDWGTTDRTVRAYMAHIRALFATL